MVNLASFTLPDFSGQPWPPPAEKARLERYALYEKFFKGEHYHAFRFLGAKLDEGLRRKIYLIANFPGLITRACADFLVGEPPKFVVAGGPAAPPDAPDTERKDDLQEALTGLVKDSNLARVLYQAEVAASSKGDAFLRVRDDGSKILIEQVKPDHCFRVVNPDNCTETLYLFVAWLHKEPDRGNVKGRCFLRVEVHLPGAIVQQAYLMSGSDSSRVGPPVGLQEIYGPNAPPEFAWTGVEEPLLIHIPNFDGGDEVYGASDYHDLDTIFEAINNRLSKIDAYLDKHSAPKLVGLPGTLDDKGTVDAKKLEYIEPENPEIGKYLPRYVTWDGNMQAAFNELELLFDLVFRISEMAPAVFGLDKAGSIESGKAMIMRFIRTTAKITRKKMFFDPAVKLALTIGMKLKALRYSAPQLDIREVDVVWEDGMPQDYSATVDAEVSRVQAGLSSKQKAIERIDGVTPTESLAELARIREEEKLTGGSIDERPGQSGQPGGPGAGPAGPGPGEPGAAAGAGEQPAGEPGAGEQ